MFEGLLFGLTAISYLSVELLNLIRGQTNYRI